MEKQIYLAGGCFWGVQKYFDLMPGVITTQVGYANGLDGKQNPAYEEVCTGVTGFAEALRVAYDADSIDLNFILDQFYKIIDPTSLNRQGGDTGSQYRTGVFYTDPNEQKIIAASLSQLQQEYEMPIVVENMPLTSFYAAEEYHQDYLNKNPGGYCHIPESKFEDAKNTKR